MGLQEEPRFYRNQFSGDGLVYFTSKVNQTDLCIGAERNLSRQARASIIKYRKQVEDYIRLQPVFLHTLEPIKPLPGAPEIVKHMCSASEIAGVGPMAAIAGAMNLYVAKDLLPFSSELLVENGGDIYLAGSRSRTVGIYAGKSQLSGKIGLIIPPADLPLGVCTSSGTVGHSLSFGKADAVVILAKDVCLADAAATAVGNIAKSESEMDAALNKARQIPGIMGAVVLIGDKIGVWGNLQLTKM